MDTAFIKQTEERMADYFKNAITAESLYLLRVVLAGICGLLLGIERSKRQKEAGIRTHFIVAAASALITCISMSFENDQARIAAQITSGIGFLGAGMIFFRRETLHGLTTAAGIWATAGIGMAMGTGLYILAFTSTVVIMVTQYFFHSKFYKRKNYQQLLLVKFKYSEETKTQLQEYFMMNEFSRFKVSQEGNELKAEAVIRPQLICSAEYLADIVVKNEDILSIERLEDL